MSSSTLLPVSRPSLTTFDVFVAGVALVVASSTLVSEFTGFLTLGIGFVLSLLLAFGFNVLLARSAAELSVAYPRSGALYDYARAVCSGKRGRWIAALVGITFFGMSSFAVAGEAASGAYALEALLGFPVEVWIGACLLFSVAPNLFGIRSAAWVTAGLLLVMLGLRWFFGLAGFFDWSDAGMWSWSNLTAGEIVWLGASGVLSSGLALGVWSFVGIEFACSLAGDVRAPQRSMKKGLLLGLVVILLTALIMGIGVAGSLSGAEWQRALASHPSAANAPQLAVGATLFGDWGAMLMAVASLAATLGSLTVMFAAMPRLLARLADDGVFGVKGQRLSEVSERNGVPVAATLTTLALFAIPAFTSAAVVDWIMSAAYIWVCLYAVYHGLVFAHRKRVGTSQWLPLVGVVSTVTVLVVSFQGQHLVHGIRALAVLAIAAAIAWIGLRARRPTRAKELDLSGEGILIWEYE